MTAHSTSDGTVLAHVLVLTDTEGTKKYWLNILQELMRVLKAQKSLGGPTRFGCTQLYTAQQVDHMRVVHAADIIGMFFLLLFFFYKIHVSPNTEVNKGVWWWGPWSSADQRSWDMLQHRALKCQRTYL